MLVLSRKVTEQIQIGDNIKLTVLRVKGNAVRIGIEAPRDVKVVRGELGSLSETPSKSDGTDQQQAPVSSGSASFSPESEASGSASGSASGVGDSINQLQAADRRLGKVAVFVSEPNQDQVIEVRTGIESVEKPGDQLRDSRVDTLSGPADATGRAMNVDRLKQLVQQVTHSCESESR